MCPNTFVHMVHHIIWSWKYLMRNAWVHIFLTADVGIMAIISLKHCRDFSETLLLLRFWQPLLSIYLCCCLEETTEIYLCDFSFISNHRSNLLFHSLLLVCFERVWTVCLCLARSVVNSLSAFFWPSIIRSWQSNSWPKEDQTVFHLPFPASTTAVLSRKYQPSVVQILILQ